MSPVGFGGENNEQVRRNGDHETEHDQCEDASLALRIDNQGSVLGDEIYEERTPSDDETERGSERDRSEKPHVPTRLEEFPRSDHGVPPSVGCIVQLVE